MKLLALVLMALFSISVFAGFEGLQSGTSLNVFNRIDCSTGLTCTRVKDKFTITSSPTISTGALSLIGAEGADAVLSLKADQADDNGDTWKVTSQASDNQLIITNNVSGADVTKVAITTGSAMYGYKQNRIQATATTITSSECGSSFYNIGAVQMELPEASSVLGCRLTFLTTAAANFDVNPDNADIITNLTNNVGDAIRNAATGSSLTLEAATADAWIVIGEKGTWSDIN